MHEDLLTSKPLRFGCMWGMILLGMACVIAAVTVPLWMAQRDFYEVMTRNGYEQVTYSQQTGVRWARKGDQ